MGRWEEGEEEGPGVEHQQPGCQSVQSPEKEGKREEEKEEEEEEEGEREEEEKNDHVMYMYIILCVQRV